MTSEQVIHFSRVRAALRNIGVEMDVPRASFDSEYLNTLLVQAVDHPDPSVQESAYVLGVSFGLTKADATGALTAAPVRRLPEVEEFKSDDEDSARAEPAGFAFSAERDAVMRRYIAGLR